MIRGDTALGSFVACLPLILSAFFLPIVFSSVVRTHRADQVKTSFSLLLMAFALMVIGTALPLTFSPTTPMRDWFAIQTLVALGLGLGCNRAYDVLEPLLDIDEKVSGHAYMHFAENLGSGLGLFMAHVVLVTQLSSPNGADVDTASLLMKGATEFKGGLHGTALKVLLEAVNMALQKTFYIPMGVALAPVGSVLLGAVVKACGGWTH